MSPRRQMKTKVFWTNREKNMVAENMAKILIEQPRLSPVKAINLAQQQSLPGDRQRAINSITAVKDVVEYAYKHIDEIQHEQITENEPEDAPVIEETLEGKLSHSVLKLIDAVSEMLAERLVQHLTNKLNDLKLDSVNSEIPIIVKEKIAPRIQLPTIVVAGLKGHQITEVQNEFKNQANVKVWTVDQSVHQLKSMCREADRIIVMTKFISHAHEQSVRSIAPDRMTRIDGGVSVLKFTIGNLLSK